MERDRTPRLEHLAARLRDEGVPPPRDLWPDIDDEIRRREAWGARSSGTPWWRAAAAAVALLMVVAGARDLQYRRAVQGPVTGPETARLAPDELQTGGDRPAFATIDRALAELGDALTLDPENRNLSRLVLMVHRTRGELLRRGPDEGPGAG